MLRIYCVQGSEVCSEECRDKQGMDLVFEKLVDQWGRPVAKAVIIYWDHL